MEHQSREQQAQQALHEHCRAKASDARLRHGMLIDYPAMRKILDDRSIVRYPCGLRFDATPLRKGEFACLEPLGEHPGAGFCLFVHPHFQDQPDLLPLLIAYYIPSINYGDVAGHIEAEIFGSTLLGLEREHYYETLCAAADALPG